MRDLRIDPEIRPMQPPRTRLDSAVARACIGIAILAFILVPGRLIGCIVLESL